MGQKIAIVTPKPQTTRTQIRGVVTTDTYQIVFLDTPGILDPKYRLHDWMVKTAYAAAEDADLVLYFIDVSQRRSQIELQILVRISSANFIVRPCTMAMMLRTNKKRDSKPERN
mgnify:CR=1 FL=1